MLVCANPVLPVKSKDGSMKALDLIKSLIPDPLRFEEEKPVTGRMTSQYRQIASHMAKDHGGIHQLLTRTTLHLAGTIEMKLLPAIRLICHRQSTRHSKSLREELSYAMAKAREDEAVRQTAEMSRHGRKLS
jgi:hypothetical protein